MSFEVVKTKGGFYIQKRIPQPEELSAPKAAKVKKAKKVKKAEPTKEEILQLQTQAEETKVNEDEGE